MIIKTKRLILRDYENKDFVPLAKMNSDVKVMEFYPRIYDEKESINFALLQNEQIAEFGFGFFALEERKSGEFIGFVGLSQVKIGADFDGEVEIGWRIVADKWNLGYASEAALACLDYGFDKIGLEKIIAFTAAINKKSQRVMEKIGMKFEREFLHPKLADGDVLKPHVLWAVGKNKITKNENCE